MHLPKVPKQAEKICAPTSRTDLVTCTYQNILVATFWHFMNPCNLKSSITILSKLCVSSYLLTSKTLYIRSTGDGVNIKKDLGTISGIYNYSDYRRNPIYATT